MIFLKSTDVLEVVLGQAVTTDLFCAWGNTSSGAFDTITARPSTAVATTVASAPGSGLNKIKSVIARNRHASSAVDVTVRINTSSGTSFTELAKTTLQAGQSLQYIEGVGFMVFEPLAANARSRQILTSTSSATYTTPAGIKNILIQGVAGAGGGGGCATAATNSAGAGGGGSGGYSETFVTGPSSSYSYQCGAAGSAATAGANAGGNGGDTTFGSILTAKGGTGGGADTVAAVHVGGAGGAGGILTGAVGDLKYEGEAGSDGLALSATTAIGGAGGRSFFGPGGAQRRNATAAGIAPLATAGGGGGGGASIISGGASQAGSLGGQGMILVTEFA